MKFNKTNLLIFLILFLGSCRRIVEREQTNYIYHDAPFTSDTLEAPTLYAVTNDEELQYGSNVAYISLEGDTIIPFGDYAYFGTDSFKYYTNVLLHPNDSTFGRIVGINKEQQILFDVVTFDVAPDPFSDGLTRVKRNGKMGYANEKGHIVIPCIYDYANWFEDGKAEVTFDAIEFYDADEHRRVESDSWFQIDRQGNEIKNNNHR